MFPQRQSLLLENCTPPYLRPSPMRRAALAAVLATLLCAPIAEGRLFYQTYGATVAAPGGSCAWNVNQDYFVPRHCDSGRYGLLSSCKTSHTTSAACRRGHPIYHGYCSPFGVCHYLWRDHVYQAHCGCTACGLATTPSTPSTPPGPPAAPAAPAAPCIEPPAEAHLEPFGIEVLGTIRVDSSEAFAAAKESVAARESAEPGDEELRLPSLGNPSDQTPDTATPLTEPIL